MSGCHTLRFDYFGTGDSGGTDGEADLRGSEADVETAVEALIEIAGTKQVTLVGLRAGANLAANVAVRRTAEIEALVLWDPIASMELQSLVGFLPQRTAMLVTDSARSWERLCEMGFASGPKPATIDFVATEPPWAESASITGALPVAAIHRVVEWLR